MTEPEGEGAPTCDAARRFLDDVAAGQVQSFPAVGLGQDLRISGPRVTGAALVEGDNLVPISLLDAFPTDAACVGGSANNMLCIPANGGTDCRSSGAMLR